MKNLKVYNLVISRLLRCFCEFLEPVSMSSGVGQQCLLPQQDNLGKVSWISSALSEVAPSL